MLLKKEANRKYLISLLIFLSLIIIPKAAFAQIDCNISSNTIDGVNVPMPSQIICPFLRLINLALMFSGVVLALFIGYGAIKMSVSLGDPKGYEGSTRTFLFAIIGFFVVVGAFSILFMLNNTFGLGLTHTDSNSLVEFFIGSWKSFLLGFLNLSEV